uniref:Uncharacterized protein n=1 Tax=Anguilla anguilla TaxID=7936 RepID=A0A0E9TZ73_ANGAN
MSSRFRARLCSSEWRLC